jgi:protein-tyrosine kinase
MGRLVDAIQKAKAMHESVVPSPVMRRSKPAQSSKSSATLVPHMAESALNDHARRIVFDSDVMLKNRIVTSAQSPGVNSAYKMLRTRVLQRMRTNSWTRLAISSARPNAGKTLTAINTAISLSFEPNQRVVLVDLDLRRPTISRYLGIEQKYGLSDYLTKNIPIEKVIVRPNMDRLLIIPNFDSAEHSSEMLSSPKMVELVDRLSDPSNSTIVIFDLPPLLDADDMLAFSPLFDALLLVVAQGETRRNELQRSFELLQDIDLLGVVLNKSRSNEDAPGYY